MEFMDGVQINDVKKIHGLGIQPNDIVKLVSQTFAEMMFKHGFVHCDPHAANLLVRPLPSAKGNILDKRKPQLILLDHRLYKELDLPTGTNYAALWKALVFADARAIKENCVKLGAGDDLYPLFAGVLTMRPWECVVDSSVDHLALQCDDRNRSEIQMYASQYFHQISELLRRLPHVIVLMMTTNDCIRAVNNDLFIKWQTFVQIYNSCSACTVERIFTRDLFDYRKSFFNGSYRNLAVTKQVLIGPLIHLVRGYIVRAPIVEYANGLVACTISESFVLVRATVL